MNEKKPINEIVTLTGEDLVVDEFIKYKTDRTFFAIVGNDLYCRVTDDKYVMASRNFNQYNKSKKQGE